MMIAWTIIQATEASSWNFVTARLKDRWSQTSKPNMQSCLLRSPQGRGSRLPIGQQLLFSRPECFDYYQTVAGVTQDV